jgi:SAM-dependent methyltransferase
MTDKHTEMMKFWSDRVRRYGADPKANTNDIWLREVEILSIQKILDRYRPGRVLDFGCANGYTTRRLAEKYNDISFLGVDINEDMIAVAKGMPPQKNLSFCCGDVLVDDMRNNFDLIMSIRVFQNIATPELQMSVFDHLFHMLAPDGLFYFIESYVAGYTQINQDRAAIGLPPLPIQNHLNLLTDDFDKHVESLLRRVERGCPSSVYYIITRLVYSKFASINNEPIDYEHLLHRLAALVPQVGEYGPQKYGLYKKERIETTKQRE